MQVGRLQLDDRLQSLASSGPTGNNAALEKSIMQLRGCVLYRCIVLRTVNIEQRLDRCALHAIQSRLVCGKESHEQLLNTEHDSLRFNVYQVLQLRIKSE